MTGQAPQVSIGLPVYNGEQYLSQAIDSILAQDFEDFELVISDNASTDRTQEICLDYARRDPRVRYHRLEQNMGAAYNYNEVFRLSTGQYFKWAAHDDLIRPGFLSSCLKAFEDSDATGITPGIVYSKAVFIDDKGDVTGNDYCTMRTRSRWAPSRGLHAIFNMSMATPVFGLMPREMLEQSRLIDSFIASDYVLIYEAALWGSILRMDDVLFERRVHADMSRKANVEKRDVLAWFDPNAKQQLTTRQKLFVEYQRSTWRQAGLSLLDRLLLSLGLVIVIPLRRLRVMLGAFRQKLRGHLKPT